VVVLIKVVLKNWPCLNGSESVHCLKIVALASRHLTNQLIAIYPNADGWPKDL